MKLETVTVPVLDTSRLEARRKFLEYRRALQVEPHGPDPVGVRRRDETLMRGYREIARGRTVLDLVDVLHRAGVHFPNGPVLSPAWFPMLAIAPADASRVTVRMDQDGSAEFMDTAFAFTRGRVHRVKVPADTFPRFAIQWTNGGPRREGVSWRPTAEAIVPTIPPDLRPPHALRGYHILWEAAWTPTPPSDPVLLKSLGGPLYAVLAQWDLTPLERAVLRGIV